MHKLYFVHSDQTAKVEDIKQAIGEKLRRINVNEENVQFLENQEISLDDSKDLAVAVYLASAAGKNNRLCKQQIINLSIKKIPLIPVVQHGDVFKSVTPKHLHNINAFAWKSHSSKDECANLILRNLELTEKHRRVFISYKQTDSWNITNQLWDLLSRKGFESFLDRFSIDPGIDFQKKLFESLGDKSFLIVLESPNISDSKWVNQEIMYALKTNMGLLILTFPETVKEKQIKVAPDAVRYFLKKSDIEKVNGHFMFTEDFMSKLPDIVEEAHSKSMFLRRRQLIGSIQRELDRSKIPYFRLSDWTVVANGRGGKDHIISITPRPPEIPDLFLLHANCIARKGKYGKGVLIHTLSPTEEKISLLNWAIARRRLHFVPETHIVRTIKAI